MTCRNSTMPPTARRMSDILVTLHLKKNPLENPPEERVIDAFTERLQVYQVPGSRVIGITFTSKDPKLAAAHSECHGECLSRRRRAAPSSIPIPRPPAGWSRRSTACARRSATPNRRLPNTGPQHGLLPTKAAATFPTQQLNDISAELTRVRGEKANAEARAQAVRNALASGEASDTLPDIMSSQSIQRLKATESGLQSQISDLQHDAAQQSSAAEKPARPACRHHARRSARKRRRSWPASRTKRRSPICAPAELERQSGTLQANSAQAGEDEVGLNALQREANAQRQLLETYLVRYREAASRADKNSSPADARIVSRAIEPVDPYFPKVVPIVIVAAVATLIMSSIVIMLAELFSGRALRPVDGGVMPSGADRGRTTGRRRAESQARCHAQHAFSTRRGRAGGRGVCRAACASGR